MTQAHLLHRLGDPFWFLPVESGGATGFYGAKTATARANAAQDHEGSGSMSPAFADIGTARLLAHRVQLFAAHQLLEVLVVFSLWRAHPEPFRAALRYYGRHVVFPFCRDAIDRVRLRIRLHIHLCTYSCRDAIDRVRLRVHIKGRGSIFRGADAINRVPTDVNTHQSHARSFAISDAPPARNHPRLHRRGCDDQTRGTDTSSSARRWRRLR